VLVRLFITVHTRLQINVHGHPPVIGHAHGHTVFPHAQRGEARVRDTAGELAAEPELRERHGIGFGETNKKQ
jgi:hypothetical protein